MADSENITVLSLCTGYGGLELGLSRALANPLRIVAVEVEAYALANLVAKVEEGKLAIEALWPDLRTFPAERFRGCFDFILAGHPCQGESTAGKRLGDKDPRWLWPDIARIVQAIEPVWCFFENVENHLNIGYPTVYGSLRDMGYKVEARLFSAAECGAPHQRKRLFILAHARYNEQRRIRRDSKKEDVPAQKNRPPNRGGTESSPSSKQLADAATTGLHKGTINQAGQAARCSKWPARPGQEQYEWEEPRTVADAGRIRCNTGGAEQSLSGVRAPDETRTKGQTQSRVGRAVARSARRLDPTANRVDRLRLLGNGVVAQQAEKAFRELIGIHEKPKK